MNHSTEALICPICLQSSCVWHDVVDFNKSCEELRGVFLPLSGVPVYYARCTSCGFVHAPEMYNWSVDRFASDVYNADYVHVDPDYVEARPHANAQLLHNTFQNKEQAISHLDYGGGDGLLSQKLRSFGWPQTQSWDPFASPDTSVMDLGKFNLITAFEVFEHVPDVDRLMQDLSALIQTEGVILFSTLLSDDQIQKNQRLSWWYASPRNGHISLFSRQSLAHLAQTYGFKLASFNQNLHAMWRELPHWSSHIIQI